MRVGARVGVRGLGLGCTVSLVVSERIGLGGRQPARKASSSSRPCCSMMPARLMSEVISGAAKSRRISSMIPETPLRCMPPPRPCRLAPAKLLPCSREAAAALACADMPRLTTSPHAGVVGTSPCFNPTSPASPPKAAMACSGVG